MRQNLLPKSFFNRPTLQVAEELLGKFLVREINGHKIEGMITEVEAYLGFDDKASHAARGRTPRAEVMFGSAGVWYIYLIYGMYCCLNIVTEREGFPAAILIRSAGGVKGPGKICKYFHIDRALNKKFATTDSKLWIEDCGVQPQHIKKGKRIGVDYAGKCKDKLWRFEIP
ncbi:MAG: DNA-3-methyladenine glycosylase [Candidatus Sungbacteria bacterium]|nr:DNA-3-methyladenine glycosylase [Candidatus Sungbacteria bacterium]